MSISFIADLVNRLHTWNPAEHLCFVNPCKLRMLAKFKHSWLASAIDNWNDLPAELILQKDFVAGAVYLKYIHVLIVYYVYVCIYIKIKF